MVPQFYGVSVSENLPDSQAAYRGLAEAKVQAMYVAASPDVSGSYIGRIQQSALIQHSALLDGHNNHLYDLGRKELTRQQNKWSYLASNESDRLAHTSGVDAVAGLVSLVNNRINYKIN